VVGGQRHARAALPFGNAPVPIVNVIQLIFEDNYRGADKSLARPTSRCRRAESIVSLEIHAILSETLGNMYHRVTPSKIWVAQFTRGDFSNFFFPGQAKDLSASTPYVTFWQGILRRETDA
jgi:hypothetical protein